MGNGHTSGRAEFFLSSVRSAPSSPVPAAALPARPESAHPQQQAKNRATWKDAPPRAGLWELRRSPAPEHRGNPAAYAPSLSSQEQKPLRWPWQVLSPESLPARRDGGHIQDGRIKPSKPGFAEASGRVAQQPAKLAA